MSPAAENVIHRLDSTRQKWWLFTRLSTAGGFLRRGNVTLLIGVAPEQVDDVLQIIGAHCRLRAQARPVESGMPSYGATVFVLDADRFSRM
jgi:uncharacterized protein YaaQ